MNLTRTATTASLALLGSALWSMGASKLEADGGFNFQPNPLGVKESAYGQVIALAAQGDIESDFAHVESNGSAAKRAPAPAGLVGRLEEAVSERTNANPVTDGYKFYLRRQVEDRLRLAFELDPSNYTNYNAYHFFLTEPVLGTRPELNAQVFNLAEYTQCYCMREEGDPRPALTAAGAAGNILLLMFAHKEEYSIDRMRAELALMDQAIERHLRLSEAWDKSGDFERLSPERQAEVAERVQFVSQMRKSADATITQLAASQAQACR